jgi:hypothetical protein
MRGVIARPVFLALAGCVCVLEVVIIAVVGGVIDDGVTQYNTVGALRLWLL